MYKIGMYGGAFNPLHLGHVNNIIMAANQCEKLYVVLSVTNNPEEIDPRKRLMWLKNITKHIDNIEIFQIFDDCYNKNDENWEKQRKQIINKIKQPIDVVFAGEDYKDKNIWEKLYPKSKIKYLKKEFDISSTLIRIDPYKYYDYLPKIVKQHYLKKVCIIGTESCGKTTLVKNLANYFNTTYVEESGRYICIDRGGMDAMTTEDYLDILYDQKVQERKAEKDANQLLLIDTEALVTLFYYRFDFDKNDQFGKNFTTLSETIAKFNDYDLYLFLEPDVKWVDDGYRIIGGKIRDERNEQLKQIFKENNIKFFSIKGDYQARYEQAKKIISHLLGKNDEDKNI